MNYQSQQAFAEQMRQGEFLHEEESTVVPMGRYQTVCGTWFIDAQGRQIPSIVVRRV